MSDVFQSQQQWNENRTNALHPSHELAKLTRIGKA